MAWIIGGLFIVGIYTFVWCLCKSAADADKCRPLMPQRRDAITRWQDRLREETQAASLRRVK